MSRANEREDGYQGWTNYETWAVNLWLSNDAGSYLYWSERTKSALAEAPNDDRVPNIWTAEEAAKFNLADQLKDEHEEAAPDLGASVWSDLLNAALSEVNWSEIAIALLNEARFSTSKPA